MFAAGLVLHAGCPPLVAHALLLYPARSLRRSDVVVLAVGYVLALVPLGVLPAIAFDPEVQGCALCPDNPLAMGAMPEVLTWSLNVGSVSLIGWALVVSALLGRRLRSATVAARRLLAPVLLPGLVYLGLVGAWFWNGLGPGFPATDPAGRLLWLLQAFALIAVAAGTAVVRITRWRTGAAVGRLVVEATQAGAGELREALAHLLKDPALAILFPLPDGRTVDVRGRSGEPGPGQVVTQLRHAGSVLAVVAHRPGVFDDPEVVGEFAFLSRLALYTERLQAEAMVQLADLRASRTRIVTIGDTERRRLERDLHDGVQQRLVTLALSIRLARMRTPAANGRLAAAEQHVRDALADLREVAHGLCPAVLRTDGLAAGMEALAENVPVRLTLSGLPARRFDRSVELAAYVVVAETVKRTACTRATISARDEGERLVIVVSTDGAGVEPTIDLEDRVGAVGGSLIADGGAVRAEFPCVS